MILKEMLDLIYEGQKCLIDFSEGIEGNAADLNAVLNDECLFKAVDYIEVNEDKSVLIHLV